MKISFNRKSRPPADLSAAAKKLWRELVADFQIDDRAGFLLLGIALKAYDESAALEAIIAKDGPIVFDRFGKPRQHPASLSLRDSRNTLLRSLKQLNLDIAPGNPLGGAH